MIYLPEVKIRKEMKSILWYILWGWVFYLVPLLGLASCALGEDMGTLIRQLWTYASENWMNLLAEFTLSDVVLSDMFFLLLAEDMCANWTQVLVCSQKQILLRDKFWMGNADRVVRGAWLKMKESEFDVLQARFSITKNAIGKVCWGDRTHQVLESCKIPARFKLFCILSKSQKV